MSQPTSIPIKKFASHFELESSANFNIRKIQLLRGKDLVQKLHRHDYFFLLAMEKANGDHEIDFVKYKIKDHSIFFLRPGQVHQLTIKAESIGYLLAFQPDFFSSIDQSFNQLLRKAGGRNAYQFNTAQFRRLYPVLDSICDEYSEKQEGYQEVIRANLRIFFIELLRKRDSGNSTVKSENTYHQERLEEFLDLLESRVSTHKQVQQYADMLNLSTYQLNAITKATLSKTSSELIDEYLILEAKRQLLATTNQVSQVAGQLGYEDVSYFIRFFKRHVGYSPDAFRNNFR